MRRTHRFPFLIIGPGVKKTDKTVMDIAPRALLDKVDMIERAAAAFLKQEKNNREIEVFFKQMIPVIDNFDAMRLAVIETGDPDWKRGIDFFYEKLLNLFLSFDLIAAAKIGETFDPALHRAVGVDLHSEAPAGVITQIVRGGWIYKGRLLRTAEVIVSKKT